MPTPDRTTIKAAIQQFTTLLRDNLVAEPPTLSRPVRRVAVGESEDQEHPRPFLTIKLVRSRPVSTVDNDRVFEIAAEMRLVTDVIAADPHDALLDKVGAVENYLDTRIDSGVIDGAEGFDDREWKFEYSKSSSGARIAAAVATQTFVVKVEREENQ